MRVTRETMLKFTQDTIARRARESHNLLAVYMTGSFLGEEFLLGGAGDIDLVFIHAGEFPAEREIVRLTDELHLDIAHHAQREYRDPRRLRVHSWLGPALKTCKVMHDPQHFLDFTQASVRGQFDRSDNVLQRARVQMEQARQIWLGFQAEPLEAGPQSLSAYLRAVGLAANAIASLSGPPLTERRFLVNYPGRAEAVGRPGLYAGMLGLLGAPRLAGSALADWLPVWLAAYEALPSTAAPARLHSNRRIYYQRAFESMLSGLHPELALWPLLRTWTMAAGLLESDSPHLKTWGQAMGQLGLTGQAFEERVEALDAYLDLVDETLENWARANGA
jgi:hypothetical protein